MTTKQELVQHANQQATDKQRRHLAARQLVDHWVSQGLLIRMPGGLIIEADRYDPAVHGPKAN